ncbi:MAG: TonB-dependent receptor plug domain-containing protein, partial [Elusimicrobiales bacterium]|nr:TonB-dependent receptor plug domain-containing protein [Elusimicrobiales bacterium]
MKSIKFFIIATIVAISVSAPFEKASAYTAELGGLTLEDLLDIPIKASSFTDEKPSESAALAHVITEETIRARGYATLLDLLEDVPQVEIAHLAGTDTNNILTVQGINGNERIQIFIDGIRVTPVSGNFYALGRQ